MPAESFEEGGWGRIVRATTRQDQSLALTHRSGAA